MGHIRVDPGALQAGGRRLASTGNELLVAAVAASQLQTSGLSGNGACDAALADMTETWGRALAQLVDGLASLADATTQSGIVYADTDANAVRNH